MSTIDNKQGAVKTSEVSTDNAIQLVNTAAKEDLMTVESRLSKVIADGMKRHFSLMMSDGNITWDTPQLTVPLGVKVTFQIEVNDPSSATRYVNCEYLSGSNTVFSLSAGDVLFVEVSKANLMAGSLVTLTDGVNFAGTVGRRIVKSFTVPQVQDLNDGNPENTLKIPLAVRNGTNLYWVGSGHIWATGTVSQIGINTKLVNVPLGTIVGLHIQGVTDQPVAIDQAYVTSNYPGWWLCDQTAQPLINYPSSTMNGQSTPPINTPAIAANPRDQGRYIRGNTFSGTISGADQVSLVAANMPKHRHTLSTAEIGDHNHDMQFLTPAGSAVYAGGSNPFDTGGSIAPDVWRRLAGGSSNTIFVANTGHLRGSGSPYTTYYRTDWNSNTVTKHTHALSTHTPADYAHENNPAFTTLVYIMKVL